MLSLCICAQGQAQSRGSLISRLEAIEAQLQQVPPGSMGEAAAMPISDAASGRFEVTLSEIQEELRRLRGEIEEIRFQLSHQQAAMTRLEQDMDLRLRQLETAPQASAATITPPVVGEDRVAAENSPPMHAQMGDEPASETTIQARTPNEHYQEAFDTLNNRNYVAAEAMFRTFIEENPGHNLIGNAYYWLGETYYVQEQFAQAAEQFRTGFQALPEGPKAPDNLLRLGMTLSVLERKEEACIIFKQLLDKYASRSKAVERKAQNESAKIQCF